LFSIKVNSSKHVFDLAEGFQQDGSSAWKILWMACGASPAGQENWKHGEGTT